MIIKALKCGLTTLRASVMLRIRVPFIAGLTPRFFAKKQGLVDRKKEKKERIKQDVAKEFAGKDEEDYMKEVKGKFEAVLSDFRSQLKSMKISKTSPKLLEKVPVYVSEGKKLIQDVADITIKTADTVCIIPRDSIYIDPILNVI